MTPTMTPIDQADREAFEQFVRDELGDVPVMDNGKYISQKINNYWRAWRAGRENAALAAGASNG